MDSSNKALANSAAIATQQSLLHIHQFYITVSIFNFYFNKIQIGSGHYYRMITQNKGGQNFMHKTHTSKQVRLRATRLTKADFCGRSNIFFVTAFLSKGNKIQGNMSYSMDLIRLCISDENSPQCVEQQRQW